MSSAQTEQQSFELADPAEPGRVVRVVVEAPAGHREAGTPRPHVLVMHGFKGFLGWGFFPELSRRLARAGLVAVRLNASGCGVGVDLENFTELEAFERDTATRQLEDLDRVRALVLEELPRVDADGLGAFGHSRGGAGVLLHAARHGDYRAVVTWASLDTYDRFDAGTKASWREQGFLPVVNARTGQVLRMGLAALEDVEDNAEDLDVVAACRRLEAPTLLFHGTADESVEPAASERLAAALANGELVLVEGAGHTFGARHPLGEISADLERVLEGTVAHFARYLG